MLALMVGALFWDLGERNDFESVQSRVAVLFYCVAFFIFMSVAVLPFTVMERGIVDKEVHNLYYHPVMYQLAQAIASYVGLRRKRRTGTHHSHFLTPEPFVVVLLPKSAFQGRPY
jgi:hypothetical protein